MLNRTAALHNLGCKVNAYETEVMQQMLSDAGYTIVPFSEKADVYIINTCSVTNMADKKSRQMISRARKNNPQAVVAAAGCYVQAAGEKLLEELSVDLIIRKRIWYRSWTIFLFPGTASHILWIFRIPKNMKR